MPETTAFIAAGTLRQPQRFVIAEGEDVDDAGEAWLSAANPVEVARWR